MFLAGLLARLHYDDERRPWNSTSCSKKLSGGVVLLAEHGEHCHKYFACDGVILYDLPRLRTRDMFLMINSKTLFMFILLVALSLSSNGSAQGQLAGRFDHIDKIHLRPSKISGK